MKFDFNFENVIPFSSEHKIAILLKSDSEFISNKLLNSSCSLSSKFNEVFIKDNIREKLGLSKDDFVILMIAEVNKNKNHKQIMNKLYIIKRCYTSISQK